MDITEEQEHIKEKGEGLVVDATNCSREASLGLDFD